MNGKKMIDILIEYGRNLNVIGTMKPLAYRLMAKVCIGEMEVKPVYEYQSI